VKTPCEMIVKTVLPTIRAEIAKNLIEQHQISQRDAARLMGITTAAVSQYLSKKRATRRNMEVFKSADFSRFVKEAAANIASDPGEIEVMTTICRFCMYARMHGFLCLLHQEIAAKLDDCDYCMRLECTV